MNNIVLLYSRKAQHNIRMELARMRCAQFGHEYGNPKRVGAGSKPMVICKRCFVVNRKE